MALPVDPFSRRKARLPRYYVRRHSSLPIPRVIAYSASASNELGFEWTLMERINGVSLEAVWGTMPFEAKMDLTADLARSFKQLWERPFPLLGSIYYADVWNQVGYVPPLECSANTSLGEWYRHASFGTNAFCCGRSADHSPRRGTWSWLRRSSCAGASGIFHHRPQTRTSANPTRCSQMMDPRCSTQLMS